MQESIVNYKELKKETKNQPNVDKNKKEKKFNKPAKPGNIVTVFLGLSNLLKPDLELPGVDILKLTNILKEIEAELEKNTLFESLESLRTLLGKFDTKYQEASANLPILIKRSEELRLNDSKINAIEKDLNTLLTTKTNHLRTILENTQETLKVEMLTLSGQLERLEQTIKITQESFDKQDLNKFKDDFRILEEELRTFQSGLTLTQANLNRFISFFGPAQELTDQFNTIINTQKTVDEPLKNLINLYRKQKKQDVQQKLEEFSTRLNAIENEIKTIDKQSVSQVPLIHNELANLQKILTSFSTDLTNMVSEKGIKQKVNLFVPDMVRNLIPEQVKNVSKLDLQKDLEKLTGKCKDLLYKLNLDYIKHIKRDKSTNRETPTSNSLFLETEKHESKVSTLYSFVSSLNPFSKSSDDDNTKNRSITHLESKNN